MRARLALLAALCSLAAPTVTGTLTQASAVPVAPGSFTSPNVEWLGNIPDAAAISAKFITGPDGVAKWMYVSTTKGLSIYDVANPELPLLTGALPLPHFENEDIDGNENLAVISTSPGGDIFLIDTTDKRVPKLAAHLTTGDGDAHVSNCLDRCERWLYATEGSYLKAVDLKAALAGAGSEAIHRIDYDGYVGPVHDVDQDAHGVVWMTGNEGGAGYATRPLNFPGVTARLRAKTRYATPLQPINITNMVVNGRNRGSEKDLNDFIMHNSKRPVKASYRQTPGTSRIADGGVLMVAEEDYLGDVDGNCGGAGRLHAFDATGSTTNGAPLRLLDTFTLSEGTLDPVKGERQAATAFCGAHWFTIKDNILAMGVYGAGTRFIDISNPRDLRQVGFFFSVDQETWASYWVPGSNVVYSVDLERGIDILKYTGTPPSGVYKAPAPVRTKPSFLRPSKTLGWVCPTKS